MKTKSLLISSFLLLIFAKTQAQDFYLGFRVDPTIGFFQSDDPRFQSNGSKLGLNFGIIADYKLTDNYLLGTGLSVNTMGGKFIDTQDLTNKKNNNYTIRYLEIPITLKLRTNEIGYSKYFGQFGLTPGVNIRARNNGDLEQGPILTPNPKKDISDEINDFRVGLVIGGGVEYSLGDRTAFIGGLSFNNGLTDISDDKDYKVLNSYVALNLGIIF